jgi:glycosyltransferase involved in cell wall biosynthesis
MHVLFLPSWYPLHPGDVGGTFFREQAVALQAHGLQMGVLCGHGQQQLQTAFRPRLEMTDDAGVATLRLYHAAGVTGYGRLVMPRLWQQAFRRYTEACGVPDVVHAHSALDGGRVGLRLARRAGVRFCISEQVSAYPLAELTPAQVRRATAVFADADRVISVSASLAAAIRRTCRLPDLAVDIIPNLLDRRFLTSPAVASRPAGAPFTFLSVGHLDANKNQQLQIRAFAATAASGGPARLRLGGGGALLADLEQQAAATPVASQISFLGPLSREQVHTEMRNCDALLISSRVETFGIVAIEALACGKPVIASRCGGPDDVVTPADGILVPVDDAAALAAAMVRVLTEPDAFDHADIRRRCLDRYGPDAVCSRLAAVYDAITG